MTEEQLFTEWLSAELPEDEYNQYFQNLAENNIYYKTTEEYDSWKSLPVPQGGLGKPAPDDGAPEGFKDWVIEEKGEGVLEGIINIISALAGFRDINDFIIRTDLSEDEYNQYLQNLNVDILAESPAKDALVALLDEYAAIEPTTAVSTTDTPQATGGYREPDAPSPDVSDRGEMKRWIPGSGSTDTVPHPLFPAGVIEWADGTYTTFDKIFSTGLDAEGKGIMDFVPYPPDEAEKFFGIWDDLYEQPDFTDPLYPPESAPPEGWGWQFNDSLGKWVANKLAETLDNQTVPIENPGTGRYWEWDYGNGIWVSQKEEPGYRQLPTDEAGNPVPPSVGMEWEWDEGNGLWYEKEIEYTHPKKPPPSDAGDGREWVYDSDRGQWVSKPAVGAMTDYQRALEEIQRLPYSQLTAQQAAQFGFDERVFEQQKYQWGQEFERDRFEWENLSAWQQSQQGIQLRDLGLQERIAQAEFQKRPMDWLAAWQFSNPTWSGVPRGTANPNAQPYIPIPEGGFQPSSQPMLGGNPPPTPMGGR